MSNSLQHDTAFALAEAVLEIVRPCLRGEECLEAGRMFYEAAKAALEKYEELVARREQRLRPSRN